MRKLLSTALIICMIISIMPFYTGSASGQIVKRQAEITYKIGRTTHAPTETKGDKVVYNLTRGNSYYVAPWSYDSTFVCGPRNLTNLSLSITADIDTYSLDGKHLSSAYDESIGGINFSADTYKIITPLNDPKQLYTDEVFVYHYESYPNIKLPGYTTVAVKVSADTTLRFPHAAAFYRIFDKNNNFIYESFASGELKLNAGEIICIQNPIFRTMNIPVYTDGIITIIEHEYYENCVSYKSFEIEGDDDIPLGTTAKYSAIYPDENKPVNRELIWSVSDPTIARVTSDGTVVPISAGETDLMARYVYSTGFVEKKKITVTNPELKDIAFNFENSLKSFNVSSIGENPTRAFFDDFSLFLNKIFQSTLSSAEGKNGICSGFVQTSLMINQGFLNVEDYGAKNIYAISATNTNIRDRIFFQHLIQYECTDAWNKKMKNTTYTTDQNRVNAGGYPYNKLSVLREIVDKTMAFSETGKNPIYIGVNAYYTGTTDNFGHALLPYKVDDCDTETKVYVYDCNHTYSEYISSNLGADRYIEFKKENGAYTGEWRYSGEYWKNQDIRFNSNKDGALIYYIDYDDIVELTESTNLYLRGDENELSLFSTTDTSETIATKINLIRSFADVSITSDTGSATFVNNQYINTINGLKFMNLSGSNDYSGNYFRLPYDRYTVKGESNENIELSFTNDIIITTVKSKDNSAVTFNYADSNANPEIEINPVDETDTFYIENMYFDDSLKYDNLLFEGTQKGKLSIIPEETGFAVTGATNLTFTATVSETPTTITLDEIAAGETIHIILDGRDISITDSASAELATGRLTSRSSTDKPVALLPEGEYTEAQTLTFEDVDDDTVIYYTTDNSTPDEDSSIYYGPITIDRSMRIKAKAKKQGYKLSSTVTLDYTLPEVSAPVADISAGYYLNTQKVRLSSETEDAEIYYTTDGSDPRYNGTLYTFPVDIDKSCTLRTCAKLNSCASETADFEYTVDIDGVYLTYTQVVDGVVTATVEQSSGKEVTLIAVQYDASGKTEAIKIHKETLPEGENLISFNSGLMGDNVFVYVWDGITPIPVK